MSDSIGSIPGAKSLGQIAGNAYQALCDRFFATAWPSYALIALLQAKVIWRIWDFKDLTTGDTSSYAATAAMWRDDFLVNFVWSPLYTMFYGTAMMASPDMYCATILHRVVIVFLATIGVLAVMRQMLPAALALLIATWWAVLPINFDTLYEVHLFALLPVLAAWLICAKFENSTGRGIALAILVATTLMLRNEYIVAVGAFGLVCAFLEWKAFQSWAGGVGAFFKRLAVNYLIPQLLVALLILFVYSASHVKFPEAHAAIKIKHTLNMCQVYAFGYQQRNPSWTLSPWLECYGLMEQTFGKKLPTLSEMLRSNFSAVLDHVLWNFSLLPNGLQVGLFNSMSGHINPDYAPVTQNEFVAIPSLCLILLIAAAAVRAWKYRENSLSTFFGPKRSIWLLLICTLLVSFPVIVTQRPRPSYLFATHLAIMAIAGASLHILAHRWLNRASSIALAISLTALVLVPPYYLTHHQEGQPLRQAYERLRPFAERLMVQGTKVYFGEYSGELKGYLAHNGNQVSTLDVDLRSGWKKDVPLESYLEREGVNLFVAAPALYSALQTEPLAMPLLNDQAKVGWERLGPSVDKPQDWLILARSKSAK